VKRGKLDEIVNATVPAPSWWLVAATGLAAAAVALAGLRRDVDLVPLAALLDPHLRSRLRDAVAGRARGGRATGTGVSSGLGRAFAQGALDAGHTVVGTVRRTPTDAGTSPDRDGSAVHPDTSCSPLGLAAVARPFSEANERSARRE
jgi:hypothetical protein